MPAYRTEVAIVGAGPAGLMLGHLLHRQGIDSIIVEAKSREHVIERVRAGVLEQGTVDALRATGLADRLDREGLTHDGIYIAFDGVRHHIDFASLTGGRHVTVYGQNELVKDLIDARVATGRPLFFDVPDVALDGIRDAPSVRFTHDGQPHTVTCDAIAGCDGFHGVCRPSIPNSALMTYERTYPFAWLVILAEAPPTSKELVYSRPGRGFALCSMRSPSVTRLYLQCAPEEDLDLWPDDRVWSELRARLETDDGWHPAEGHITQKSVTGMRSFVTEPMRYGRLFLAGDAAH